MPEDVRLWADNDRFMRWFFPLAFFIYVGAMLAARNQWPTGVSRGGYAETGLEDCLGHMQEEELVSTHHLYDHPAHHAWLTGVTASAGI